LSIALGREAILAGYTVQFTTATTLVAGLAKAQGWRAKTHEAEIGVGCARSGKAAEQCRASRVTRRTG
jgi:hypothetical protein